MSTLSPKGRDLINAGRRAFQPTAADRERLLGALRSHLGESALPPDMGSAATAAAAGKSLWALISAVVVGVGIVGGAVFFALHSGAKETPSPATSALTMQVSEPVAPPLPELPLGPEPTQAAMEPLAPRPASGHRAQDRLAAEVALLSRATRELRAGRPVEALKALDEYRSKFPRGLLTEEQRAARAQSLCALGRFDEAKAKLAGLAPRTPLAVQAKQFCDARLAAR
jgi:hypothetical protein